MQSVSLWQRTRQRWVPPFTDVEPVRANSNDRARQPCELGVERHAPERAECEQEAPDEQRERERRTPLRERLQDHVLRVHLAALFVDDAERSRWRFEGAAAHTDQAASR